MIYLILSIPCLLLLTIVIFINSSDNDDYEVTNGIIIGMNYKEPYEETKWYACKVPITNYYPEQYLITIKDENNYTDTFSISKEEFQSLKVGDYYSIEYEE